MGKITVAPSPQPFAEAVASFGERIPLSHDEYLALDDVARARAFTMGAEISEKTLELGYGSILSNIAAGEGPDVWRRQFSEFLKLAGEEPIPAARLNTIINNATLSSFSSGRWAQINTPGALKAFPYLMYDAVGDDRTRKTHQAQDGKIFPVGHPYWDTWNPQNGHNCRCGTRSLTAAQAKAMGANIEATDGDTSPLPLDAPDAGFRQNVGKLTFGARQIGPLRETNESRLVDISNRNYETRGLGSASDEARNNPHTDVSAIKVQGPKEFRAALGLTNSVRERLVQPQNAGAPASVLDETIVNKMIYTAVKDAKRLNYAPLALRTLEDPHEVWLRPMQDPKTGQVHVRYHYIGYFRQPGRSKPKTMIVIAERQRGYTTAFSFVPTSSPNEANKRRRGELKYRRDGAK